MPNCPWKINAFSFGSWKILAALVLLASVTLAPSETNIFLLDGTCAIYEGSRGDMDVAMAEATCKISETKDGVDATSTGTIFALPVNGQDGKVLGNTAILITANHVFETGPETVTISLRKVLNREKQEYERVDVTLRIRQNDKKLWFASPDVDLAAIYIVIPPGCSTISSEMLLTEEVFKEYFSGPGAELHCLGYPHGVESTSVGFPVLRAGRVASYPIIGEKVYALDYSVFPGDSGGPVYVSLKNVRQGGQPAENMALQGVAGMISGQIVPFKSPSIKLALGEVIPAAAIRDLLSKIPPPNTAKESLSSETNISLMDATCAIYEGSHRDMDVAWRRPHVK